MNAVTSLETTESTVQYNQPLTLAKHVLFVPRSDHSLDLSSCEDTLYQSIERGGCIPKFASARSLFALLKSPASYWVFGSDDTLQQDNHHIIGRPKIGTRSALKYRTRVPAKNRSLSTAKEQPSKPKRRPVEFNESDENIEEEDELDSELSRLLIDKLSIFNA